MAESTSELTSKRSWRRIRHRQIHRSSSCSWSYPCSDAAANAVLLLILVVISSALASESKFKCKCKSSACIVLCGVVLKHHTHGGDVRSMPVSEQLGSSFFCVCVGVCFYLLASRLHCFLDEEAPVIVISSVVVAVLVLWRGGPCNDTHLASTHATTNPGIVCD